jgi:hypothetical protein
VRFILVARLSTEAGNKMIDDPNGIKPLQDYINTVKAEAAYASESHGDRTFYVVVDIPSADMIPSIVEPLFHLGATVEIQPAMTIDDLTKAMQRL